MILLASMPGHDFSRLWLAVTIFVAVLPPCLMWLVRRRWQFTLGQLFFVVAFVAAELSLSRDGLAVILKEQGSFHAFLSYLWWGSSDASPLAMTSVLLVLSLMVTLTIWERTDLPTPDSQQPQSRDSSEELAIAVGTEQAKEMISADPATVASAPAPRWFHLTLDRLLILLLTFDGLLYLSQQFPWFPFHGYKGWPALIAGVCGVIAIVLVVFLPIVVPTRLRRWFPAADSSLLLLIVLIAIPSGWLWWEIKQAQRQHQCVAEIIYWGGAVTYGHGDGKNWLECKEASALKWPLSLLGADYFYDVSDVLYPERRLYHEVSESVRQLECFDRLTLYGSQIIDKDLRELEGMTCLRSLRFDSTEVTDAGLRHLEWATNLVDLDLRGAKVTPEGVKRLQRALPNCKIEWNPTAPEEPE